MKTVKCPTCDGHGVGFMDAKRLLVVKCQTCNGSGKILVPSVPFTPTGLKR